MASVNSPNRTCASDEMLELYNSKRYLLSISWNLLVPLVSLFILARAFYHLFKQSIIEYSTRILLATQLFYAMVHQISYFCSKTDQMNTLLFKLSEPCYLQHTSYECRYISIASTTALCGLAFTPIAMSIDRALAVMFKNVYYRNKHRIGIFLSIVTFSISFSTWFVLTCNDSLTGYLNNCFLYPSESTQNFKILLYVILVLASANLVVDSFLLRLTKKQILWKRTVTFNKRVNAHSAIKCAKAVFWISLCECGSSILYSGSLAVYMQLSKYISTPSYTLLLSIGYVPPLTCLALPLFYSYYLEYVRNQRTVGNLNKRETLEEHMAKLAKAWA